VLCDICDRTFSSEDEAVLHMQQSHNVLTVKGASFFFFNIIQFFFLAPVPVPVYWKNILCVVTAFPIRKG
jgi:hypothetical protein